MKFSNRLVKKILFIFILITGLSLTSNAQNVTVTATVGTSSASYDNLGSGFSAINSGRHKGVITINITANTTESSSGAVLNASGSGSALYTSIRITPSGARTVSAAVTAGSALIALNGADNVTIDGLNSGSNSLTLSNTTASATAGTSTIRFYGDATSNKITNCIILGSSTMSTTTNGGTIWFDASAVAIGNDNDTISNCNIGPSGSNLPTKSIYACGTTTSYAKYNSGVVISGNNIYDYFNEAAQSNGVYISAGNTGWTISSNKFYQTASRTQTTGSIHAAINIASALGNENMQITGNIIGYSSSAATGTYKFVGGSSASKFYPIYISAAPANGVANSIQGNTITAISMTGPFAGEGYYDLPPFAGIYIGDDTTMVNIGTVTGNLIGSKTASGAITFTSSATTLSDVYGIFFFPISNATINNNSVGGMTLSNSSTGSIAFYGIRAFTWINYVNIMRNDTVGFTAAPIRISASSAGSKSIGILSDLGTPIITNSMVSNISMDGANTTTGTTSAITGICADRSSYYYVAALNALNDSILNVSGNVVHSLSNSSSAAVTANGIVINGDTSINECVSKNYIHSLSVSNASATINGIYIVSSNANYYNNMIRLGIDASGNNITTACKINGINETSGANSFYFNSIYVGGTGVGSTANATYALHSTTASVTRKIRNNIFQNSRSNASAGGGNHYAIKVGGTGTNPSGLTINNNIYYVSGTDGILGSYNSSDVRSLAVMKTAIGQDANSYVSDPAFKSPANTSSLVDLHLQSLSNRLNPAERVGAAIAEVTDDYDGQIRSTLSPTDIGADAADFYSTVISYTNLSNATTTANRTISYFATITCNGIGLDTGSTTKPRMYYKKKSDANAFVGNTSKNNGWKHVSATGSASPFSFTINYSIINGGSVSLGDTIQYFLVAQDLATTPTVTCNPYAGFSASAVGKISNGPKIPNYYIIESKIAANKLSANDTSKDANLRNPSSVTNSIKSADSLQKSTISKTTEPYDKLEFNASVKNENAILNWLNFLEVNVSHYNIMRSVNSIDFEKIGTENASGNSSNTSYYSFTDENSAKLFSGKAVYYQIKMFELDGTSKLSGVKTLFFKNSMSSASINPYFSDENLIINLKLNDDSKITISVLDMNGKLFLTTSGQYYKGASNITLSTNDIPTGIYIVRVESATESIITKILKNSAK